MSKRKTNLQPVPKSADKKPKQNQPAPSADNSLFDRVASILEQARGNVVRAVNTNMVLAYWLIGREIVQELQGGKSRAEYGKQVVEQLSARLTERYGTGYSEKNLQNFRRFYLAYSERIGIPSPVGREFESLGIPYPVGAKSSSVKISSPVGRESSDQPILRPVGEELPHAQKSYPLCSESLQGFSSQLTWSHYRTLMRMEPRVQTKR